VAGVLAGFAHERHVRSVGDPERAAPVSAQEVADPFRGHVVPEPGPKEGRAGGESPAEQTRDPRQRTARAGTAARRGVGSRHYIFIGSGVPSDQFGTGAKNTVSGSMPPVLPMTGEPERFAPHWEGSVRGRKYIKCGCQCPPTSSPR
jgi:hypothetical protein